ncbi:DUF6683 family protein [Phenylobacterium sp. LjRoot225]|uniref:DUF6683 family protein n=1 Tax=Phenylobacterium sp. LjRoot225 TaxID=3342285 RepID=UPI003F4FA078
MRRWPAVLLLSAATALTPLTGHARTTPPRPDLAAAAGGTHAARAALERDRLLVFGGDLADLVGRAALLPPASAALASGRKGGGAASLAAAYPAAERPKAQQLFTELLAGYHQLEARLGIAEGDVAGAAAALIAAGYMADQDRDVSDADFRILHRQLRTMISPGFRKISPDRQRETYERLAILGTYIAVTRSALKQRPDVAAERQLRAVSETYLASFVGRAANELTVDGRGLRFAGAGRAAAVPAPPPAPTTRSQAAGGGVIVDRIVFDMSVTAGFGGAAMQVRPVMLLSGGVACRCLDEDLASLDLSDLRRRRPEAMGAWRQAGDGLQVKWAEKWRPVTFRVQAKPLGDGWRTSGTYERLSGFGGAGGPMVAASRTLTLSNDGGFALNTNAGTNAGGVASRSSKTRSGRYQVKGWVLVLRYDDGRTEGLTAMTSAEGGASTLWLAGSSYERR